MWRNTLREMSDTLPPKEVNTVTDLLNEVENENLYRALLTVDKRTLQIVLLLKMKGIPLRRLLRLSV